MLAPVIQRLIEQGVSDYTVILLLFLPVITSLIAFARYVIGWKSLNVYTTVLLSYGLFDLGYRLGGRMDYTNSLLYGGLLILTTSLIAMIFNNIIKELRIHYLSKVSIVVSFATFGVILLLYISTFLPRISLNFINPLTLVIFLVIIEALVKNYIRHGLKQAIQLLISTILLAYTLFFIMSQGILQNALFDYPEISILMIASSFFIGRYRGLKLSEYVRFRNILSEEQHDSEDFS